MLRASLVAFALVTSRTAAAGGFVPEHEPARELARRARHAVTSAHAELGGWALLRAAHRERRLGCTLALRAGLGVVSVGPDSLAREGRHASVVAIPLLLRGSFWRGDGQRLELGVGAVVLYARVHAMAGQRRAEGTGGATLGTAQLRYVLAVEPLGLRLESALTPLAGPFGVRLSWGIEARLGF